MVKKNRHCLLYCNKMATLTIGSNTKPGVCATRNLHIKIQNSWKFVTWMSLTTMNFCMNELNNNACRQHSSWCMWKFLLLVILVFNLIVLWRGKFGDSWWDRPLGSPDFIHKACAAKSSHRPHDPTVYNDLTRHNMTSSYKCCVVTIVIINHNATQIQYSIKYFHDPTPCR